MSVRTVTAQFLLKGSFYALEQCGILLRDAVTLYNSGSYSSAVVLAAFAREESGRSFILRDLREGVVKHGAIVTIEDINRECADHIEKQKSGQISTVLRASANDRGLGRLLVEQFLHEPQSKEYKEIEKQLIVARKKKRQSDPHQRHKTRLEALYIEPKESGSDWSRPSAISPLIVRNFVNDAVNDYSLILSNLRPEIISKRDPEFASALTKWNGRPELPLPQRPDFFKKIS